MTEADWLTCTDPAPMLNFLRGKASARKLRLFAAACCRRIWSLLDERNREAIEHVETRATEELTVEHLTGLRHSGLSLAVWFATAGDAWEAAEETYGAACRRAAQTAACHAASKVVRAGGTPADRIAQRDATFYRVRDAEVTAQCELLRDVAGNPFRQVRFDPSWGTANAKAIAATICQEGRFEDMPILADALEEIGCNSQEILDHCRNPGEHVLGCWVLDLVLDKS
jgi:hypothetical protein